MKRFILFSLVLSVVSIHAQNRVHVPKHLLDKSIRVETAPSGQDYSLNGYMPLKSSPAMTALEEEIGDTRYDNQSNASSPKKIIFFDDGTIGATWTRSMQEGSFFADRGTGYNYFNGLEWGEWPTGRVEDIKVHRPVYAPWGENGEMIISHTSGAGLYKATRPEKGTGDWEFSTISGPPDENYIVWARAVTSGPDHNRVHLLSLTLPESHGGTTYQGLDGALLYSLSTDGGENWDIEHEILEGMTSDEYTGFAADIYAFAEPVGDVVAFVVGDPWTGLFLMKSTDGGFSFEKTIIWNHPYPDWQYGMSADTFYCADGSHSLVIDSDGLVHAAFGITRVEADDAGTYWYPWVDGIAYWNEDMSAFSNNLYALAPDNHPNSELIEDYNLIGWTQDINNNGQLDFLDDLGIYSIGLSSMPQLVIDEDNHLYLVYSSVTETYGNGLKNYRHLWFRAYHSGSQSWYPFIHLTDDLVHIFDECVFPAVASGSDDHIHLIYQADPEPGTAVWYAQHNYVDNRIIYLNHEKWPFFGIEEDSGSFQPLEVSQNIPNPFSGTSRITVDNHSAATLRLDVFSPSGQTIFSSKIRDAKPGKHFFEVDGSGLSKGVYFYTVSDGSSSVTKKMIVD